MAKINSEPKNILKAAQVSMKKVYQSSVDV